MLTKEEMEKKYFDSYGEAIVFDDIKSKGDLLVASKKSEKERFLVGADGVENERNAMIYYVINTSDNREMKMTITSQEETELPHQHIARNADTSIEILMGDNVSRVSVHNVYIDTSDKSQIGGILTGLYPEAVYFSSSAQTEKLFSDWYHCSDQAHILKQKHKLYLREEIKEIKKNLKTARNFFVNFVGSKTDLVLAKEKSSMLTRVGSFCKRLALRNREPEIKTTFMHYTDNSRF